MRFIMQCESKEDTERAVTLLKSYRPWYGTVPVNFSASAWPPVVEGVRIARTDARARCRMPKLDVGGGSLLIRACLRSGDLQLALDVLHAHRQLRASLSKSVCLDLLVALSKEGRTDDLLAAFSYMRAAQPGVVCAKALGIVAAGLGQKGLASQAAQLVLQVLVLALPSLLALLSLLALPSYCFLVSCRASSFRSCLPPFPTCCNSAGGRKGGRWEGREVTGWKARARCTRRSSHLCHLASCALLSLPCLLTICPCLSPRVSTRQTRAAGVKPTKFCYRVVLKGCNHALADPDTRASAEQVPSLCLARHPALPRTRTPSPPPSCSLSPLAPLVLALARSLAMYCFLLQFMSLVWACGLEVGDGQRPASRVSPCSLTQSELCRRAPK